MSDLSPLVESLVEGHEWLRIADPAWQDPLDASYGAAAGGRWNPPDSFAVLYLNEDVVTARINMRLWVKGWPYEPEDLVAAAAPVLVGAELPPSQAVADAHTPEGVAALGLAATYPLDASGKTVAREICQEIGAALHAQRLDGVRCRSAQTPFGAGRELAWFPDDEPASQISYRQFDDWFWD